MNEIIETLGMTLLWEVISERIENVQEICKIINNDSKDLTGVEIIDSDSFEIINYSIHDVLTLDFEMPFIMIVEYNNVQRLRLQARAVGKCKTLAPNDFEFNVSDFIEMNRIELLRYKYLVTIVNLTYHDIELDEII